MPHPSHHQKTHWSPTYEEGDGVVGDVKTMHCVLEHSEC